jgi:hypothetical protein
MSVEGDSGVVGGFVDADDVTQMAKLLTKSEDFASGTG